MSTQDENIAQTVADLVKDLSPVKLIDKDYVDHPSDAPFLISVPAGRTIQDFGKQIRDARASVKPFARKGKAALSTTESLIDWANRFKGETSMLFADNKADQEPWLLCIADYHAPGATLIATEGDPSARHCQHRAEYRFPLSKQWLAWKAVSGVGMSGTEMGAFLEDNILDVIDPPPQLIKPALAGSDASKSELRLIEIAQRLQGRFGQAHQLLDMASKLTVNESNDYAMARNSTTGEMSLQIKSEMRDETGESINPPKLFLLAISVFEGGPAYRIPVRFQLRKSGSTVKFFLTLHDPREFIDHAFNEAVQEVVSKTELPILFGTPEA